MLCKNFPTVYCLQLIFPLSFLIFSFFSNEFHPTIILLVSKIINPGLLSITNNLYANKTILRSATF